MPKHLIIGAGLTGLTTAHELARFGHHPIVLDSSDAVGGAIRSIHDRGFLFEEGANSFLLNDSRVLELLSRLNLVNRLVSPGPNARNRYILKKGRPVPAPLSPLSAVTTPLFSTRAKLRLLTEPFRPKGTNRDESLADFITRRFGREILDYAVQPFVSGIYAGDPSQLLVRHAFPTLWEADQSHGSIIRARLAGPKNPHKIPRRIVSFPDGLAELPLALAATDRVEVRKNAHLTAIEPHSNGWRIRWTEPEGDQHEFVEHLIVTVPAHGIPKLPWDASLSKFPFNPIAAIPYAPVAVTGLGYRRMDVSHPLDGFGLLIPECESQNVLGTLFSSSLFPNRAPADQVLITVFSGGELHPERALLAEDDLVKQAHASLAPILGIKSPPIWSRCRLWRHAIPQATLAVDPALAALAHIESQIPNLHLAGNFRSGISAPQCVLAGLALAAKLNQHRG